jgi:hypothetical protein
MPTWKKLPLFDKDEFGEECRTHYVREVLILDDGREAALIERFYANTPLSKDDADGVWPTYVNAIDPEGNWHRKGACRDEGAAREWCVAVATGAVC